MLSVVVEQPNQMAVRERPEPRAGAGEVRVRVQVLLEFTGSA
jgi:NADPH:quinone reductase-like Zn-dependent oxidoreductase